MGTRHVRRLRLRAPEEGLLGRGRFLVEDAMRTASLPETNGARLYIVRRFDLGVIEARRAPGVLAQRIERRFAALRGDAVHAAAPAAGSSAVVYFNDTLEPFILLVRQIAAAGPPRAWFWPVAVPGYSPGQPRDRALRAAVSGALTTPAGKAASLMLGAALDATEIDALCGAMCEADARAWLVSFPPRQEDTSVLRASPEPALSGSWQRALGQWAGRWGREDPRTWWLAAVAVVANSPGIAFSAGLMRRAAQLMVSLRVESQPPSSEDAAHPRQNVPTSPGPRDGREPPGGAKLLRVSYDAPLTVGVSERGRRTDAGATNHREGEEIGSPVSPAAQSVSSALLAVAKERAPELESLQFPGPWAPAPSATALPSGTRQRERPASRPVRAAGSRRFLCPGRVPWEGVLQPTAAAGLLFLVRVLIRLGFPSWLDDHPALLDSGFAVRLLYRLGLMVRVAPEDPALALWGREDDSDLSIAEHRAVCGWCLRLARWARRHMALSLRTIIGRPARIVATRTHVDVVFAHCDADVRIRSVGLDTDPGWVPWLGRIIQFHFMDIS